MCDYKVMDLILNQNFGKANVIEVFKNKLAIETDKVNNRKIHLVYSDECELLERRFK